MENPDKPRIRIVGLATEERKERMRTEFQEIVEALKAREGEHYNDAVQAAFNTVCILHAFTEMLTFCIRIMPCPQEMVKEVLSLVEQGPAVAGQVRYLAATSIVQAKRLSMKDAYDENTNSEFAAALTKLRNEVLIMLRKQEEYHKGKK